MEKYEDDIEILIGKQLAGEASVEEIAVIDSWEKESEDNQRYADHLRKIFDGAGAVVNLQEFDTDAAWTAVKQSMGKSRIRTIGGDGGSSIRQLAWRIAASIIVVVGLGYFAYTSLRTDHKNQPLVIASDASILTDTLPDGSEIVLNKESTLKYAFDKTRNEHVVGLSGEAYFSIRHDETKTFVVDINGVFIKDIGTSFNVKAYPGSNTVEVVVESGEVMFYTATDSGVYLRANGKGIFDKTTKQFTIDQPESNVLAYKTKFFTFSNSDLGSVADALNAVYDQKIVINENLRACHLTVSFNNEPLDEIVAIISETLGLTVKEGDDEFVLEGAGCGNE